MGMFDSFYLRDNREVQTKSLDNSLNVYHVGSVCPNYEGNFDGPTGTYYLIEDTIGNDWVSLFIIDNVFIDYQIGTDYDQLKEQTECLFAVYKSNKNLLTSKLFDIFKSDVGPRLTVADKKITHIDAIIRSYNRFLEDPNESNEFIRSLYSRDHEKFQSTPIQDIIADIIK
jgi:hypothetical protein